MLPVIVGVVFSLGYAGVAASDQVFAWQRVVSLWGGAAIAVAGMLDHALLLNTLHNGTGTPAAELEPVRTADPHEP